MSADDAQHVLAQAENARAGIDAARELNAADPEAASARLASVRKDLGILQTELNSRRPLPTWTTEAGALFDKASRW